VSMWADGQGARDPSALILHVKARDQSKQVSGIRFPLLLQLWQVLSFSRSNLTSRTVRHKLHKAVLTKQTPKWSDNKRFRILLCGLLI
jgi:hypothetical protein